MLMINNDNDILAHFLTMVYTNLNCKQANISWYLAFSIYWVIEAVVIYIFKILNCFYPLIIVMHAAF